MKHFLGEIVPNPKTFSTRYKRINTIGQLTFLHQENKQTVILELRGITQGDGLLQVLLLLLF